jgi:uncharacterized paraquat-inducible protein A
MNRNFAEMITITGMTLTELIDIDKKFAEETLPGCDVAKCTEDWHICSGCDCHLDDDNTCNNCD